MSRVALVPGRAREYETIYILRPNIDKEIADNVASRVAEAIKGNDGLFTEAELWGSRRLAYPISKHHRGTYVYVKYLARGEAVAELERQLRLVDAVIRYQTIQLRDDVTVESVTVDESETKLDFDMPFEPDEPERTYERELGLDAAPPERRRRDDRYDRFGDGEGRGAAAPAADGAAKPADAKAADAKAADAKPADAKPAEAKAADAKPAEAKPAEAKPAEAKPAETKPAETKPAETKPADAEKKTEGEAQ